MSVDEDAWDILGIAPTDDAAAIRSAYAARLKAIDPETDPQAFIALRDAFEAAQANTIAASAQTPQPERDDVEPSPEPSPPGALEGNAQAIVALLYDDAPVDENEMLRLWDALSRDPRMEEVGLFDQVERWAAGLIAETAPRSSPLVIPATEFFGWTADEGTIAQSPALAQIVHRYHDLRFLEAVANDPGHSHHAAWIELTTPAPPGARRGTVGPRLLFDLLEIVRGVRPELEAKFDPERVALWDRLDRLEPDDSHYEPSSGYSAPGWIGIGFAVIYALMLVARACTPQMSESPPPYSTPTSFATPAPILVLPPQALRQPGETKAEPARPSPSPTPFIPGAPR